MLTKNKTKIILCIALTLVIAMSIVGIVLLNSTQPTANAAMILPATSMKDDGGASPTSPGSSSNNGSSPVDTPARVSLPISSNKVTFEGNGTCWSAGMDIGNDFIASYASYSYAEGSIVYFSIDLTDNYTDSANEIPVYLFYLEGSAIDPEKFGQDSLEDGVFNTGEFSYIGNSGEVGVDIAKFYESGLIAYGESKDLYLYAFYTDNYGGPRLMEYNEGERIGTVTYTKASTYPITPTKEGYTFTGWFTDEECTTPFTSPTITSNVTLYAGWRANRYTIRFNGNGHTGGATANLDISYDEAKPLIANGFTKTGYKFLGWSVSPTGSVVYKDCQDISNLTTNDGEVIDLYAVWQIVQYTVKFSSNGGHGSMENLTLTVDTPHALPTNTFPKYGYTFVGWLCGEQIFEDGEVVTNLGDENETVILFAQWTPHTYSITYNGNGADSGAMSKQSCVYDIPVTFADNQFTREGYVFKGWATSANGPVVYESGTSASNIVPDGVEEITLFAVWEVVMCKVTLIVDGQVIEIILVEYGTPTSEILGSAVDSSQYELEEDQELPN